MEHIKIGFALLSNSSNPIPSTRIAVLNMFPYLREAGFDPYIVFEPETGCEKPELQDISDKLEEEGFQLVYFQKIHGKSVETLAQKLRLKGIKTIYGVCDLVNVAMANATDITITVTDYLKSLYPENLQTKIRVVHDGIERSEIHKSEWGDQYSSKKTPLNAVLVTSAQLTRLPVIENPPEWLCVTIVGRYAPRSNMMQRFREARWNFMGMESISEKLGYLRFLKNPNIRCEAWDAQKVYGHMQQADIGIIPIDTVPAHEDSTLPPSWKVKSENRLTMKMSIGLPVVATPIPAYIPVIEQGVNGFLVNNPEEWLKSLQELRDPEVRRKIGMQARKSVLKRYTMEEQAKSLIAVINELVS